MAAAAARSVQGRKHDSARALATTVPSSTDAAFLSTPPKPVLKSLVCEGLRVVTGSGSSQPLCAKGSALSGKRFQSEERK